MDVKDIMKKIKEELGDYVEKEIGRTPMIVPMYVYMSKDAAPEKTLQKSSSTPS